MKEYNYDIECSMKGGKRNAYRISLGNFKEGDHLEELGIDDGIIIKCILKK